MANAQYAAYLFHFPIVVLIQYMVANDALSPFSKFLLVTVAAVPLTFPFADLIGRPALLRRIL
jgi:peptidoglycan/LPS O-acetylase OafA/YrhL